MGLMDILSDVFGGVGYALDTPGALTRGLLAKGADAFAGREIRDDWRASGRDLLEATGIAGPNQEGLDFGDVAGFATDLVVDPMNLMGLGWLGKTAGQAADVGKFNKRADLLRSTGGLPEELIPHLSPSVLDEAGKPRTFYHGTPNVFDEYDMSKMDPDGLFGKGIYTTASPVIASEYASKGGKFSALRRSGVDDQKIYDDFIAGGAPNSFRRPPSAIAKTIDEEAAEIAERMNYHPGVDYRKDLPADFTDFPYLANNYDIVPPAMNVRRQFLDIRNPINMDVGQDAGTIDRMMKAYGEVTGNPLTRDLTAPVLPVDKYATAMKADTLEQFPDIIKQMGHDGIVHQGGARAGRGKTMHDVAIAMDPSQVYKPWIAPTPKTAPSTRGPLGALLAYNLGQQEY